MKFFRLLLVIFITSLSGFITSDSLKPETPETIEPFEVQNLEQTPETKASYELITKFQNQQNQIQERIDSVFNHLDSISTDTTRQHQTAILPHRTGSHKSYKVGQYKQAKRANYIKENQSNNLLAEFNHAGATNAQDRIKDIDGQKQGIPKISLSANRNNSNNIDNFNYSINGAFQKRISTIDRSFSNHGRAVVVFES